MRKRLLSLFALAILLQATPARSDIFQWEFISPDEPTLGKQQSTSIAPDGAGVNAVPGADLTDRNLTMAYLSRANLYSTSNCDLSGCHVHQSNLTTTNLTNADLSSANLQGANISFAILNGADLTNAYVGYATLTNADLRLADLAAANFDGAALTGADFRGANVRHASFRVIFDLLSFFSTSEYTPPGVSRFGSGIALDQLYTTASYNVRDLTGIGLGNNALSGGNFAGQNLTEADFTGASLNDASFAQANLANASLEFADLTNADLTDAIVRGANFHKYYSDPNGGLLDFRIGPIGTGITPDQLYSTGSFKAQDLAGIDVSGNNLAGANMSGQNLTNAVFRLTNLATAHLDGATLAGADFTGAEIRDVSFDAARCYAEGCLRVGTGITLQQLYSTASYQAQILGAINLRGNNVRGGNFAGQNLSNANLGDTNLTGADFTGAGVQGTSFRIYEEYFFGLRYGTGITLTQLYSTASYQSHDLRAIDVTFNDLVGGNFVSQHLADAIFFGAAVTNADFSNADLSNANFYCAVLTNTSFRNANLTNSDFQGATIDGADFTAGDTRGAILYFSPPQAITTNLIRYDGQIDGVNLDTGGKLVVRDYDGDSRFEPARPPIPIKVDQHFKMDSGGMLHLVFDADAWDSTISFASGIPVALGGQLELAFSANVNLASQVGRTFALFDWTGVTPTGAFAVSSPYAWNLSHLYTTGEVTLIAVPEPTSFSLTTIALSVVILRMRRCSHEV